MLFGRPLCLWVFQSTLPHGERLKADPEVIRQPRISIHAPARGATAFFHASPPGKYQFQSTLPHGERRSMAIDFSPKQKISIHAPARGATPPPSWGQLPTPDFNPRSRTGSDEAGFFPDQPDGDFNPRSRTGSDACLAGLRRPGLHFNPRSRTGSDCPWRPRCRTPGNFNPRSRTGSDSKSEQIYFCYCYYYIADT